ncbi:LamG-like jellyroll fold domain-containing protein [Parabacteroides sp. FAFU027]|uniref:LamG-like jellyroll fold domain-containing protein n=1 Tax=Parabacteroides sp. FAFU027 TaxID=2922715 RepID=UPI001FAFE253|nr:LamG-like jellyroll fold domain-containing protein [Parabacteroides sp. FAFU027]
MKKILLCSLLFVTMATMAQMPIKGLIGCWSFNGNANDESNSNVNGTVYGATLVKDRFGNPNRAYSFDGVNDYIWIGYGLRPSIISVSFWFISNSKTSTMSMIRDRLNGYGFVMNATSSDGDVPFHNFCFYGTGGSCSNLVQTKCNDSIWHHGAMTYDGYTLNTYLDNNLVATSTGTGYNALYFPYQYSNGLAFGRDGDSDGHYFKGALDDIRIYNRALSKTEVEALYYDSPCSYIKYDTVKVAVTDTLIIKNSLKSATNTTKLNEIKVYPNPTHDVIHISINDIDGLQESSLSIINSLGLAVYKSNFTQNNIDINTSALGEDGTYFIQIFDRNKKLVDVRKIILEK